jgi:C-terminal processing protease CtpA/Prc
MKRLLTLSVFIFFATSALPAQEYKDSTVQYFFKTAGNKLTATKTDDLYILGKVWGFLKYFHPQVTAGKFDWDKELLHFLPGYLNTRNSKERNDSLLSLIKRCGDIPVNKAGNYALLKNTKLLPDFSWISVKNFSPELVTLLRYIKDNRKDGDQYYIKFPTAEGIYFTAYQHENAYFKNVYPDASYRLLALYRFWNAIEYWYPYKYNLPVSWNEVLKINIPEVLAAKNTEAYVFAMQRVLASVKDGHGFIRSAEMEKLKGNYYLPFTIKYVQDKFIIASITNDSLARAAAVKVGDIIEAIDEKDIAVIVKEQLLFICASNNGYALLRLANTLTRTKQQTTRLTINTNGISKNITVNNSYSKKNIDPGNAVFSYQKDSAYCLLKDKIAYFNLGKLLQKDSAALADLLAGSNGLIIDCRQNAIEEPGKENANMVVSNLVSSSQVFNKFSTAQPAYPGAFLLVDSSYLPANTNPAIYNKKIVVLVNEATISVGEIMAMSFSKAPKAVLMGSNTAGADGGITGIALPGNIVAFYTGFGMYWPNGKETQRVGIPPGIKVYPSIAGYKQNKDELLEQAIHYLSK